MESIVSLKRKRSSFSSQNPFVGTFTRSKSQIYHHRHRSGRVRSDSFRRCQFYDDIRPKSSRFSSRKKSSTKSVTAEILDSTEIDDMSRVLIKDLRTRRVFSPCSEVNESRFCVGSEEEKVYEKQKKAIEDGLFSNLYKIESINSDVECLDSSKMGEKELDVEVRNLQMNSTDLHVAEGNARSCVDGEISGDENVRATPPDAEILQKLPIASDNRGPKSVLSSRSRFEVFKVPYSFSYRRLLPYLMAMEQDNSSTATIGNSSTFESQPVTIEDVKVDGNSMEDIAGDSGSCDKQNFADQTVQQIVDSEILIPAQKDSSNIVSFPTSLDDELCEKHTVENSNENIEVPSKNKNLESSILGCSPKLRDPCINGDFNEAKALDGEGSVEKHPLFENDEVVLTGSVGIEVFDSKCTDKTIDANHVSSCGSDEKRNSTEKEGNDEVAAKIEYSNRTTEIFGSPAYKESEYVSQSSDQVLKGPLNGSFLHNSSYFADDKTTKFSSKRKLGLSPVSQIKLFKTGGSFNYRRLLPLLMDIAKDNSGDSRQCHSPKLEKRVEENLVSPSSIPVVHETPAQILNNKSIHLVKNNDSCIIKMEKQASNHESCCMKSRLTASDHSKAPNSVVMEKKQESEVNLADGSSLDTVTMYSSAVSPYSCAENVVGPLLHSEADCKKSSMVVTDGARPVQPDSSSLTKNSYKLEAFGPLEIAVNGSRKGILKRSPRGCRGPCSCLNCASFRLNAERAFEFSKNQMQDAEEVALELIEELSHLQNMLGRAASACGDNVVIPINQVKEACIRVSEAQEAAKNRLMDMNYDLNIHCKTTDGQRPRVKFANNVNQRMISNANPNERQQQ